MLPETMQMSFFGEGIKEIPSINVFYAAIIGLAVGALISMVTSYYTSLGKKPVMDIVQNSATGAGTNIIAGLAVGMKSTFASVILFAAAIYGSYELAGFYGVALAASAMMATTAMQLAIDAFGPIADNAGGSSRNERTGSGSSRTYGHFRFCWKYHSSCRKRFCHCLSSFNGFGFVCGLCYIYRN